MVIKLENKQSIGIPGVRTGEDIFPTAGAVPPSGPAPMAAGDFQDLSDYRTNLIKSPVGYFWCYTHLQNLPIEKQSIDKRYCQRCYEVLADEADDLRATGHLRRQWWVPQGAIGSSKATAQVSECSHDVSVTTEKCLFCGKELTKRRKTKLFCNATCRVRYSRQPKVEDTKK